MESEKYQGWTNWDTWNCNLWLTNDEWSYRKLQSFYKAEQVEKFWEEFYEGKDGIDTSKVNFEEIFESFKEE